jgi:hypothetical protein
MTVPPYAVACMYPNTSYQSYTDSRLDVVTLLTSYSADYFNSYATRPVEAIIMNTDKML